MSHRAEAVATIAIIGMGCRSPGGALGLEAYWDLLCEECVGIGVGLKERRDIRRHHDSGPKPASGNRHAEPSSWFEPMDTPFYGLTAEAAEAIDPAQRLLLEVAWEALEVAGVPSDGLAGTTTGIFMGCDTCGPYTNRSRCLAGPAAALQPTRHAVRLAWFLDLRGPCMALDSAATSSLLALHLACQSLWLGESELALAGASPPSFQAQAALARQVGARAGIDPRRIRYFEAYGNGTAAEDLRQDLIAALGEDIRAPRWAGSVKTHLGHREGAAGVAGVIKAALSLHHGLIPPGTTVGATNTRTTPAEAGQYLPRRVMPMTEGDGSALVGVLAYDHGGSHAHVLLQAAPPPSRDRRPARPGRTHLLLLSARGEAEQACLMSSLGELHVHGGAIDWSVYYGAGGSALRRPTYPWQRGGRGKDTADLPGGRPLPAPPDIGRDRIAPRPDATGAWGLEMGSL